MIITDDDRSLSAFYSADVHRLRKAEENAIIALHAARYAAHMLVTDNQHRIKEKIR